MSMLCKATGQPRPRVTWRKAFGHVPKGRTSVVDGNLTIMGVTKADGGAYACSAKNILGQDSAVAIVMVIDKLKFILTPPLKVTATEKNNVMLNCAAQGATEVGWKRAGKNLPQNHVVYPNGTLLVKNVATGDAGSYTCVAKNRQRSTEANSVVEVLKTAGNYITGCVTRFRVFQRYMSDKGRVDVTVIIHDKEILVSPN